MSLTLHIADLVPKPNINEYFLGYMEMVETTCLNLSTILPEKLKELNIPFDKWTVLWQRSKHERGKVRSSGPTAAI